MDSKESWGILAIVAIVALVAIVTLFNNNSTNPQVMSPPSFENQDSIFGMAISSDCYKPTTYSQCHRCCGAYAIANGGDDVHYNNCYQNCVNNWVHPQMDTLN